MSLSKRMRLITSVGAICTFLVGGLSLAQLEGRLQKNSDGPQVVKDFIKVDCVIDATDPTTLVVTANVVDTHGPPSKPRMILGKYDSPPEDGIQDLFVLAIPAPRGGQPAESVVVVKHAWKGFRTEAPWLKGIRVHCASGMVTLAIKESK